MQREKTYYAHTIRAIIDLRPFGKNARRHSDAQINKLTRLIKSIGFTAPVLIDEKDQVLAGYGRLMAAREVPLTHVPCIVVTGLTDAQKRTVMISDNAVPLLSSWDHEALIETLGDISTDGFDVTLTGFDAGEIETMLAPGAGLSGDLPDLSGNGKDKAPSITVSVPSAIDIPSVAAILRKAISAAGYKGVKVREPK